MPATIVLTAVPGKFVRSDAHREPTFIIKPFGKKLGIAVFGASTVDDIAAAVRQFGEEVGCRLPDHSFYVTVRIRPGDVAPPGFEERLEANGLGQDAHTRVVESSGDSALDEFDGLITAGGSD